MSNNTIIKVEGLSKKYLLNNSPKPKSDTLYGNIWDSVKSIKRAASKKDLSEFWALKNVSFEISRGDRVGVIGRNGAGKSTLLKMLSRITPPTSGRIEYTGRMASLLEVGTGFHGDLSGRENIYLNGSILGMSKQEIDKKFDEIVDFAEIEKFLDTPVKRYSSGMYVRLAFAVAAHLEPEILIVDEVLAVGDAAFQKKCMGKMQDVSKNEGRTILFVSHNMAAIQNLCDKCLYLKNGEVVDFGLSEKVIPKYLLSSQASNSIELTDRTDRMGNGNLKFLSVNYKDQTGKALEYVMCGQSLTIETKVNVNVDTLKHVKVSIGIDDEYGNRITILSNDITNELFSDMTRGEHMIKIAIPKLPLKRGDYVLTLFSEANSIITDWIQEAIVLKVEAGDFFDTGKLPEESQGSFYMKHNFGVQKL